MAGFDAGSQVDPLDWSFRPYVDASGTIPEPTGEALRGFLGKMRQLTGGGDDESAKELAKRLDDIDEGALAELDEHMFAAVADLTGGSPSAKDLAGLPVRPRQAFIRWLMREMSDPNSSSSATRS